MKRAATNAVAIASLCGQGPAANLEVGKHEPAVKRAKKIGHIEKNKHLGEIVNKVSRITYDTTPQYKHSTCLLDLFHLIYPDIAENNAIKITQQTSCLNVYTSIMEILKKSKINANDPDRLFFEAMAYIHTLEAVMITTLQLILFLYVDLRTDHKIPSIEIREAVFERVDRWLEHSEVGKTYMKALARAKEHDAEVMKRTNQVMTTKMREPKKEKKEEVPNVVLEKLIEDYVLSIHGEYTRKYFHIIPE